MKIFFSLAVIAVVAGEVLALTAEQLARVSEQGKRCAELHNVNIEELSGLVKDGGLSNVGENIKCFANCLMESEGFLKDGVFQEAAAIEELSKNGDSGQVRQIVEKCKDLKGSNNCDTAFKLFTCYAEQKIALGRA